MSRIQTFVADASAAAAAMKQTRKPPMGRIARRAHLLKVALSQENYTEKEAGESILSGDGEVDVLTLLTSLLEALGIHVEQSDDEAQFKANLAEAALKATTDLAQAAQGVGKISGAPAKVAPNKVNPLIPGGKYEAEPNFMGALSLENESKLRAQAANAAVQVQEPQLPEAEADRLADALAKRFPFDVGRGGTGGRTSF